MSEQKQDNFMQQGEGAEFGYFAKRKDKFNAELEKGFKGKTAQPKPKKAKKGKK